MTCKAALATAAADKDTLRTDRGALLQALREAGADVQRDGKKVKCPAHDDAKASAAIYQDEDGIWRVKCHTNKCGFCGDVFDVRALKAAGGLAAVLPKREGFETCGAAVEWLRDTLQKDFREAVRVAGEWTYENGVHVVRYEHGINGNGRPHKELRQFSRNGDGWLLSAKGITAPRPPLYQSKVRDAKSVIVVEGEQKADRLRAMGFDATTFGASKMSKPHLSDVSALAGKDRTITILPDNDDEGRAFADGLTARLLALPDAPQVKIVALPGLPEKGDIIDYCDERADEDDGAIAEGLRRLIDATGATGISTTVDIPSISHSGKSSQASSDGQHHHEAAEFVFYSADQFDALDLRREYHVPGILAAGPVPTVIAGSFKTLKTSIGMDLALSLATGSRFLRHFPTAQCRVAVMSGESGGFALQSLARRVARARGWTLASIGDSFNICTRVVSLGSPSELQALERFIDENKVNVLMIDPTYLALKNLRSDDTGNLFAMGRFLEPLARIGERTGSTPIIIHHNSRGATRANEGQPAELADIAWSGFAEWAGQWILLARRERYDPDSDGHHRLWLTAGGRDGHSTLVGVNITEGREDDPQGRRWEVEVEQASSVRHEAAEAREEQREQGRQARQQRQTEADCEAILSVMRGLSGAETKTAIRTMTGLRSERFSPAFARLISDGDVTAAGEITKANGQRYEAFTLSSGRIGTHRDKPAASGCDPLHRDAPPVRGRPCAGVCSDSGSDEP